MGAGAGSGPSPGKSSMQSCVGRRTKMRIRIAGAERAEKVEPVEHIERSSKQFGRWVAGPIVASGLVLGRTAVAAPLNVAHPDVNSTAFTTLDVISATQAALVSGDYDTTKDAFEEANESGCPLN